MSTKSVRIAIIGGGITGCSCAAALSKKGRKITIFDAESKLVEEASYYNEGRIHLGYTYGMDKSLDTARLMAKTALVFEKLLVRWFGKEISSVPRTDCFNYLVHKEGLMTGREYGIHARKVGEVIRENLQKGDTYFGVDLKETPRKLSSRYLSRYYNPDKIAAVFRTNEICIDPEAVAKIIRKNTAKIPGVTIRLNSEVAGVKVHGSVFKLRLKNAQGQNKEDIFDYVVNASGRSLLLLDSFMGIKPPPNPLFRLKYLIRTKSRVSKTPSTGIVLGKFGEVVSFDNFQLISWYPAGRLEWYEDITPHRAEPRFTEEPAATELKKEIILGLSSVIPKLKDVKLDGAELKGNWIYAPGTSDVNNPKSKLHKRTDVGIKRVGNYFSMEVGKYTTAPYFANQLASMFE